MAVPPPECREKYVLCVSPLGLHRMAYTEWGDARSPRVLICLHGLARNGRDFDDVARAMAGDYRVVCPDLVGRGKSGRLADSAAYRPEQYVSDMLVLLARLDVESVDWLGTSLGGVVGLVLAGLNDTPIRRLLLNDVGPEIHPAAMRRIADYLGRAPSFANIDEAERYVRLVGAPFGNLTDAQWRRLTETNLRALPDGRFEMLYDPAIAEPFRDSAAKEVDLWRYYDRIRCPTLVLRGAQSDLLTVETAQAMTQRGPRARVIEIADVGHAPVLMDEAQIQIVRDFFNAAG